MCTVSLIQTEERIVLTSNRDEHKDRQSAEQPRWHVHEGVELYFPKDPKGGGSWIALRKDGYWGVVLNGAFENHSYHGPYRRSRGMILLDLLAVDNPFDAWQEMDLNQIEPFTLILGTHLRSVLRWTGSEKAEEELIPDHPYIWASATLYSKEHQRWREELFESYLEEHPNPSNEEVLNFHSTPQGGSENGLVIDRDSGVRTVSVTQIVLDRSGHSMNYKDQIVPKSQLFT